MEPTQPATPQPQPMYPHSTPPTQQPATHREARTRSILLIVAAVVLTIALCGQCAFDIGVTTQIGKFSQCIYPPHSCTDH